MPKLPITPPVHNHKLSQANFSDSILYAGTRVRLATKESIEATKAEITGEPRISPNINPIRWLNDDCATSAIPHTIDVAAVPTA